MRFKKVLTSVLFLISFTAPQSSAKDGITEETVDWQSVGASRLHLSDYESRHILRRAVGANSVTIVLKKNEKAVVIRNDDVIEPQVLYEIKVIPDSRTNEAATALVVPGSTQHNYLIIPDGRLVGDRVKILSAIATIVDTYGEAGKKIAIPVEASDSCSLFPDEWVL